MDNSKQPVPIETRLTDVEVTSDDIAIQLMISFLSIAQRRGIFGFDESAKIWDCVKRFIKPT